MSKEEEQTGQEKSIGKRKFSDSFKDPSPSKKLQFIPSQYLKKAREFGQNLEQTNPPQIQEPDLFANNDLNILKSYFDGKFKEIDTNMNKKFKEINSKFNEVDKKLNKIDNKTIYLEKNFLEFREDINSLTESILRHQISKVTSKNYAKSFILCKFTTFADYLMNILTENSIILMEIFFKCDSLYQCLSERCLNMLKSDKNILKDLARKANEKILKIKEMLY